MMSLARALAAVKEEGRRQQEYTRIRDLIASEYPDTVKALRLIDNAGREPRNRKGFNLVKRENKKLGFVYYVRYWHKGRMLPTKWNTRTNIPEEAGEFARRNRERLIEGYERRRGAADLETIGKFYSEGSEYLVYEGKRNRPLSAKRGKNYHSVILNKFIPFLKKQKIFCYGDITAAVLSNFQDSLLAENIRPQTVNDNMKAVRKIFKYLARKGLVKTNPCRETDAIAVRQSDRAARGCYEIDRLKGVFADEWEDATSYLLCLLIYTTGMRNGEISRLRMEDIITENGCYFIDIKESKTRCGVRLVPLHGFVYGKLAAFFRGKAAGEPVFGVRPHGAFERANAALARRVKADATELKRENITFYSGRHFWKTLMNAGGLGEDAEEIFMGHKVTGDVAKLYNHRDKRGWELMVKKAEQVFAILDKSILEGKSS